MFVVMQPAFLIWLILTIINILTIIVGDLPAFFLVISLATLHVITLLKLSTLIAIH